MAQIEVPPGVVIDTLRNEIASLNDQRLAAAAQVAHLEKVVGSLNEVVEKALRDLAEAKGTTFDAVLVEYGLTWTNPDQAHGHEHDHEH